MKKHIRILLLSFVIFACKKEKVQISPITNDALESLKIPKQDFPYFLKEDLDTILLNKKLFNTDKSYRGNFFNRARKRQREIRKLKQNAIHSKNKLPYPFKTYLLAHEIQEFNPDSILQYVKLNELYKLRRDKTNRLINYAHFLDRDEIQKLIEGDFADSVYYKELAFSKHKNDSITHWTKYNKRKDSLQSIIHPIDSLLSFGPKALGHIIANNQNKVSFSKKEDATKDTRNIEARKTIYDTWMYFLKLHPPSDEDLDENYVEKLVPPVSTYQYLNLGIDIDSEYQMINPHHVRFQTRISNIGEYEVYYTTTSTDYPSECSEHLKKEENCCFGEEFYCESTGYIILYDRGEQHSIIIPGFVLKSGGQGYILNTQFFYINDNTIYIYRGSNNWLVNTFNIEILNNGKVVVNEECVLDDDIDQEKYDREGINSVSLRFKHDEKGFSTKRDSVINKIQSLVSSYPFGSPTLKDLNAFKDNLKLVDSTFRFYMFSRSNEKLHSFYTLPLTSNLKKINIGNVEYWNKGLLQNLQKSWICSNIEFDSDDINDFKLPNIKNYEVYLSVYNDYGKLKGILVLYNPTTQLANIINVLDDYSDSNFRFFYINSNSQIEIYQGYKNITSESDIKNKINISKTHIIEVLSDGEINVSKQ